MLVLCLLAQPCLVDPCVALAFKAIRNFAATFTPTQMMFLKISKAMFPISIQQRRSLVFNLNQALGVFHMTLFAGLSVGIGDVRVPISEYLE